MGEGSSLVPPRRGENTPRARLSADVPVTTLAGSDPARDEPAPNPLRRLLVRRPAGIRLGSPAGGAAPRRSAALSAGTSPRRATLLLVCGSLVVTLAMGIRHTFGLFLQPMTLDLGWSREAFSFAVALQNLVWGASQPLSGWLADRYGAGRVLFGGALLYAAGLVLMAQASSPGEFALSAGVLIGFGLSGTTFSVVYGAVARAVEPRRQAGALALVGAAGSFGQFMLVPIVQQSIGGLGWLRTLFVLAFAAAAMAPLAAGAAERHRDGHAGGIAQSAREALAEAFAHRSFALLTLGFFVCGFQVVFIGAHLPAYVLDQGLSGNVGMLALALIGLFNIFGTFGFGHLGGRYSKKHLLAGIYLARSAVIAVFLLLPLSGTSVALFAAAMGVLWLGTVPLTNGLVAQIFGVRYLAMLSGVVFFSHQIGSFLGVWLGGLLFDATGSYTLVWMICIGLGAVAALLNLPVDERPVARIVPATP
ncbi:MAG: MFS transporter [Betaproteobacteria bacterium]|nr:MFS transporter [Betaproteobacteria bacterium]